MGKKLLILIIFSFISMSACAKDQSFLNGKILKIEEEKTVLVTQINDRDNKIKLLNHSIEQLEEQINSNKMEKDILLLVSDLSREFVRAHTTGDKEKLHKLMAENIILEERDNNLYGKINESEWLLFSNEREIKLDDWVIRGHQYFSDNETIRIDIREFYIDLTGTPVTPPTFLSLTFKKYINEWKIVSFGFDV